VHALQFRSILFTPSGRWRAHWTANELHRVSAGAVKKLPPKKRKAPSTRSGELMQKVHKPMAPPAKVEEDLRKYNRARERRRLRKRSIPDQLGHEGTAAPDD
jgi:hypothetical protein